MTTRWRASVGVGETPRSMSPMIEERRRGSIIERGHVNCLGQYFSSFVRICGTTATTNLVPFCLSHKYCLNRRFDYVTPPPPPPVTCSRGSLTVGCLLFEPTFTDVVSCCVGGTVSWSWRTLASYKPSPLRAYQILFCDGDRETREDVSEHRAKRNDQF